MNTDEKTMKKLRDMLTTIQQQGQIALLIWKSPEERAKWGSDEKEMFVENAFDPIGKNECGIFYGNTRTMELDRAIRGAVTCGSVFVLAQKDGTGLAAKLFHINKLMENEGQLKFACRGMLYGHLNGPIIAYPSYQKVEFEVKK